MDLLKRFISKIRSVSILGKERKKIPTFPYYICLEITNACNLRCVQCLYKGGTSSNYAYKKGFIELELAKKVIEQLKNYNCSIMLNGDGEALLHPRFHEIAEFAVKSSLPSIYFNTNGVLFTPEFTDHFIKYFQGSVSFSLDGFKESHERIRVGSDYDLVIGNISYLLRKISENNLDIKVNVAYCNYDQPVGEKDEFIKYWINKVHAVTVGEVYDNNYKIISNRLNGNGCENRVKCGIPWETLIVRWDGSVVPCSNCFSLNNNKETIFGNVNDDDIIKIWHDSPFNRFRSKVDSWDLTGSICEKCERWNMYVEHGTSMENDIKIVKTGVFTTYSKMSSDEKNINN